jgi:hypothetical protein
MDIKENQIVARLTIIAITATLIGGGLTWLDGRHASASDVSELTRSIEKERLSRIEFEIEEIERLARGIKRMSAAEQASPQSQARLLELDSRRDRYLRKREELLQEVDMRMDDGR